MQITGPLSLSAGLAIDQQDPAKFTPPNQAVQLQNYSGFGITGQIGGLPFAIPPFTAATLHYNGVGRLQGTVSSTISAGSGTLTLVWLQPKDVNPVKDGPLTAFSTSSRSLSIAGAGTSQMTISGVGPSDIAMTIYTTIQQGSGTALVTVTGVQSSTVYLSSSIATGANTSINVPINGANDTSYLVTISQSLVAVISNTQVSVSSNGGASWSAAIAHGMPVACSGGMGGAAANGNQVVLFPSSGTAGRYSTDGGLTWAANTLPASGSWKGYYVGNGIFFAFIPGTTSGAWSNNGGQTWTAATLPSASTWTMAAGNGSGLVSVVSSSSFAAAYSSNNGQTWTAATNNVSGATWVMWTNSTFWSGTASASATSPTGQTWTAAPVVNTSGVVASNGTTADLLINTSTVVNWTSNLGTTFTGITIASGTYTDLKVNRGNYVAITSAGVGTLTSAGGQVAYVASGNLPSGTGVALASGDAAFFIATTAASASN